MTRTACCVKRMEEVVDGHYQKYKVSQGWRVHSREHFFGKYPELLELVGNYSDEKLEVLRRGGHDPEKVYAAYKMAMEHTGQPTVILAKTIKGYGMGESGEGRNIAHNKKKANEQELLDFRSRFGIPISDDEVGKAPFYKPADDSVEMNYLRERREALGGSVPSRPVEPPRMEVPRFDDYRKSIERGLWQGDVDHDGRGSIAQSIVQGQKDRQTSGPDRSRRIAHVRDGGDVPRGGDLRPHRAALRASRLGSDRLLQRGQRWPAFGGRNLGGGFDVVVQCGRNGVQRPWHQHDSVFYLLLDVRIPANRRTSFGPRPTCGPKGSSSAEPPAERPSMAKDYNIKMGTAC